MLKYWRSVQLVRYIITQLLYKKQIINTIIYGQYTFKTKPIHVQLSPHIEEKKKKKNPQ